MIRRLLLAACIGSALIASPDGASAQTNKTFLYDCDSGLQVAVYFDRDAAFIQLDGKALKLPQRLSGSGVRYSKGGVSFWIKGNAAMLKRTRTGKTINCVTP
jgi:membrane-bound inhibitor of C-type lysozyme